MLIYFIVALLATLIGATAGMGGGVIIKPILDLLGDYNITTISIFSSITVLSMAIVSTAKQIRKGLKITDSMIYTTIGAVFGGILGSLIFSLFKDNLNPSLVTAIQSIIILVLLCFCLLYEKLPVFSVRSVWSKGLVGCVLGMFSAFLGIGGGPINVAVLCIVFGYNLRNSARVSVFIILFSQVSGLMVKGINGLFSAVDDYSMLFAMITAAIIGGFVGAHFNMSLSDKNIKIIFKASVSTVIIICFYNAYSAFSAI